MGFGDYLHWTAVIRDMYNYINKGPMDERINKINQFKHRFSSGNSKYGIQEFKKDLGHNKLSFL